MNRNRLECKGAKNYSCWCGITFDGPKAARDITAAIIDKLKSIEPFDDVLVDKVRTQLAQQRRAKDTKLQQIDSEIKSNLNKIDKLTDAIADCGKNSPQSIIVKIQDLEDRNDELKFQRNQLESANPTIEIPSAPKLCQLAIDTLTDLATDSEEFWRIMNKLVTNFYVLPYRPINNGHVVLRGHFDITLPGLLDDRLPAEIVDQFTTFSMVVDLYDEPMPIRHRKECVAMQKQGLTYRQIAKQLNVSYDVVNRALRLDREMQQCGFTDPYVRVTEPPADYPKMKRHLHGRYEFRPIDGHEFNP